MTVETFRGRVVCLQSYSCLSGEGDGPDLMKIGDEHGLRKLEEDEAVAQKLYLSEQNVGLLE